MTTSPDTDRHRAALLRLVVMLLGWSGLVLGQPAVLQPHIRRTVLWYLRPMEAALRRLIFVRAQGLSVKLRVLQSKLIAPAKPILRNSTADHVPAFPLFDPRNRSKPRGSAFAKHAPRISTPGYDVDPVFRPIPKAPPKPPSRGDSRRVLQRMIAVKTALEDLQRQAERLARMMARRAEAGGLRAATSPIRPGRPPGLRARGRWEVDEILRACHLLALRAVAAQDTS